MPQGRRLRKIHVDRFEATDHRPSPGAARAPIPAAVPPSTENSRSAYRSNAALEAEADVRSTISASRHSRGERMHPSQGTAPRPARAGRAANRRVSTATIVTETRPTQPRPPINAHRMSAGRSEHLQRDHQGGATQHHARFSPRQSRRPSRRNALPPAKGRFSRARARPK